MGSSWDLRVRPVPAAPLEKLEVRKCGKNKFKHCSCGPGVVRLSPSGRRLQLLWQRRKKKKEYDNHQRRNRDSVEGVHVFGKVNKSKMVSNKSIWLNVG